MNQFVVVTGPEGTNQRNHDVLRCESQDETTNIAAALRSRGSRYAEVGIRVWTFKGTTVVPLWAVSEAHHQMD